MCTNYCILYSQSLIKRLEEDPALMSRVLQRVNEQESARQAAANSQANKKKDAKMKMLTSNIFG